MLWEDDSKISWLIRSKTLTQSSEGETIVYAEELNNDMANYDSLLTSIAQHIKIEEQNGHT